ncbi:family 43 glycosylhydrolase [Microbacterium sp. E-13]|uniref:glycoside hydrolase family 43 protein n=1 Tax=Microbacterium sp. E-13 TaxID=3404048 RepID=UPI003CF0C651
MPDHDHQAFITDHPRAVTSEEMTRVSPREDRWGHVVLDGDFADPDVIFAEGFYWLITSTFHYSPGMAILRSDDLRSWQYAGHCVDDITAFGQAYAGETMSRGSGGMFAGSIREHDGKYFVYFTTFEEGLFVVTAPHPAGPWTRPALIWDEPFWDDPCPIWSEDGEGWLVLSRPGYPTDGGWKTYVMPLSWDGLEVQPDRLRILDDTWSSEGNKAYNFDGRYYVLHNEVRSPGNRVAVIMRAPTMDGPWEKRDLLVSDATDRHREPNQGSLLQSVEGDWVFVTHHGRMGYPEGRPVSVLPVSWEDGWPIASLPPRAPSAGSSTSTILGVNDAFVSRALGPQWEWVYQPAPGSWEATTTGLRLAAMPPRTAGDPRSVRNLLTQRMLAGPGQVTLHIDTGDAAPGTIVNLGNLGSPYSAIQVRRSADGYGIQIIYGEAELRAEEGPIVSGAASLWLRVSYDLRSFASFSYSVDGERFLPLGSSHRTGMLGYRGNRISVSVWVNDREQDLPEVCGWVTLRQFTYARSQWNDDHSTAGGTRNEHPGFRDGVPSWTHEIWHQD